MSPITEQLARRVRSFGYAFAGIGYALKTQPNTWIHMIVTILCVIVGLWLGIERRDWALLVLTIAVVWAAELVNTAVESVVDMSMPDVHPLAKAAKDVAAGAVLVTAMGAIIVGLLILGPPLWAKVFA